MTPDYEIIIVGGGPAGLTAGIYAARARRKTVLLEKHGTGGQMALTWEVENYPGVEKIGGYELGQIMERQARSFGLESRNLDVTGIAAADGTHRVSTSEGELVSRTIVIRPADAPPAAMRRRETLVSEAPWQSSRSTRATVSR